jgi:hypothetical protein
VTLLPLIRAWRPTCAAVLLAAASPASALTLIGHYDGTTSTVHLDLTLAETFVDVFSLTFRLDHSPGLSVPAVQKMLVADPALESLAGLYTLRELRVNDTQDVVKYSFLAAGEPTLAGAALAYSFDVLPGTTMPLEFSARVLVEGGLNLGQDYSALRVSDPVVIAIPEPSTWALLLAGGAALATVTRRRLVT